VAEDTLRLPGHGVAPGPLIELLLASTSCRRAAEVPWTIAEAGKLGDPLPRGLLIPPQRVQDGGDDRPLQGWRARP